MKMTARSFNGFPASLEASWALSRSARPSPPIPSPPNSRNVRRRIGPRQLRMASDGSISCMRLPVIAGSPTEATEREWTEVQLHLTLSPTNRRLQCFYRRQPAIVRTIPTSATAVQGNPSPPLCCPTGRLIGKQKHKKTGRVADTTPARRVFFFSRASQLRCARWFVDDPVAGTTDRAPPRLASRRRS